MHLVFYLNTSFWVFDPTLSPTPVCLKSSNNNFLSLQTDHDMRKCKRNIRGTKKLGCPAVVHVYEMLKFPDFNVCLLHSDLFVECGLYANPCLVTCTLSIAIEMRSKMLWLTAMTGGIKITQEQCQGLSRDRLQVEILQCFTLSALKTTNYLYRMLFYQPFICCPVYY